MEKGRMGEVKSRRGLGEEKGERGKGEEEIVRWVRGSGERREGVGRGDRGEVGERRRLGGGRGSKGDWEREGEESFDEKRVTMREV